MKALRPGAPAAYGRRLTDGLTGVALIVFLLGLLAACDRSAEVGAAPKPPSVTVVAAAQRPVPVYGQYVGQTEAVKTVEVRARVEGFIERQVAHDTADGGDGDARSVRARDGDRVTQRIDAETQNVETNGDVADRSRRKRRRTFDAIAHRRAPR